MLKEIKETYSFPYAMAAQACTILAEYFHTIVSENEIGYIVICIALSIERKKKTTNRRNIVLICESGTGSAKLFQYRFEEAFKDYLNRVEVCDIYSLPDKALFEVDYIFRPFQFSSMYQYLSIRCNTFSTTAARGN
nr:PRD domain-containing protein [uncultured Butyricicoccus sp.]